MTEVRYPERRSELGAFLQDLANPIYQWEAWIKEKHHPSEKQGFDTAMHFILDDNNLDDNTQACLGVILKTQEEVETMRKLADALIAVLDAVNNSNGVSEDYITHPLWADVLAAAREALDAFTRAEYCYPLKKL
jgi:hypothetical protein